MSEGNQLRWTVADFALHCPPLLIRQLEASDAEIVKTLYTNARIQQFIAPALNDVKAQRRFQALLDANHSAQPDKLYLIIADKKTNQALGLFAVFNIDPKAASCEFGIMLIGHAQGGGVARHALTAMLSHLQHQLGFAHIFCVIHQQNFAAQRLARQCKLRELEHLENNLRYVLDQPIQPWLMR